MNRFCDYCGQKAGKGQRLCVFCGARLPAEATEPLPPVEPNNISLPPVGNFDNSQTQKIASKLSCGCSAIIFAVMAFIFFSVALSFCDIIWNFEDLFPVEDLFPIENLRFFG